MDRLYAIVRSDITMPEGKMAAQAGHAFLEAYLVSDRELQDAYRADGIGTKVVLSATLSQIETIRDRCEWLGVPHRLIVDTGHVCPPDFDGSPVTTALGIGLDPRAATLVRNLNLVGAHT